MKLYMQLDCSSLSASYLVKGREPARAAGMPSGKASDRRGGEPLLFLLSVRSFFSLALLAVPQGGAAPTEKTLSSDISFIKMSWLLFCVRSNVTQGKSCLWRLLL